MHKADECHASLLPEDQKDIVKLIRQGNIIYKFAIKNGETIQRYIKHYGEIKVQQKIQNVMLYIINMDELEPAEVQLSTSLFQVKIDILPWDLSNKVFFENPLNNTKYFGAKQQYKCIICEKDIAVSNSECIIEKGAMKDEEERLTKFLDVHSLNAEKLSKRTNKKKEGVFTRLFKFFKII